MTKRSTEYGSVLGISHLFWASPRADRPEMGEGEQEVGPFLTTLGRLLCGIPFGHNLETVREPNRMYLRCINCGSETPGWDLRK